MRFGFKHALLAAATGILAVSCVIDQEPYEGESEEGESLEGAITVDTSAVYTIVGQQSNKCVEIRDGSTAGSAAAQITGCNGTTRQQFRAESAGGTFYRLKNVNSGQCLAVNGSSTADGATIVQSACNGSAWSQQFEFIDVASGVQRIMGRASGKALDIMGRSTADGTGLQQWTWSNGDNQKFSLRVAGSGSSSSSSSTSSSSSSSSSGTGGSGGSGGSGGAGGGGGSGGKFVGNITTSGAVRDGFSRYWNQITPENEGKWDAVERTRGSKNWAALDRIYNYAKSNNVVFKQHVFVWGAQQPSWLASLSASEQQAAVKDWMRSFCARYPDTKYIDVVNEPPPHTTPSYKNGIGGDGASGYDWIVNSFKWAREYCPNAVLILNDYNNIEYEGEHQNFMKIARAVINAGAPVDALGAQAHDAYRINTATVKGYVDKLASLGKPVYITEYDIGIADDNQQKRVMEEQFTMFWNHPSVKGITLWGYIVGATWRDNTGLQQSSGAMRPAMTWLMDFLDRG
ncbi:endo-1,4-beta-xylanase [Sorangium sp. So ce1151]|uniref:endo-1,4-beta-xylanase n=1 Tax=Sorangium sp. So ce1151 TaxID=3133332 RepID=UPI003F5DB77E